MASPFSLHSHCSSPNALSNTESHELDIGMEDGDISHTEVVSRLNAENKIVSLPDMANYPDLEVTVVKSKNTSGAATKVNGESDNKEDMENEEDEDDSTDEDALVIDEERKSEKKSTNNANRKRLLSPSSRTDFKGFKKRMLRRSTEVLKIVNDYISAAQLEENENITSEDKCDNLDDSNSQGELDNIVLQEAITKNIKDDTDIPIKEDNETPSSNVHNFNPVQTPLDAITEESIQNTPLSPNSRTITINKIKPTGKKSNKKNPSPKLTEYAQYLGLQPTVKFKCYKCSESSFPSMNALNEHQQQCLVQPPTSKPTPQPQPSSATTTPSTNFRVTRKVYLCSACGTYYENWNLFLHMREVHRRFICLYCLGMFSLVEKLSQHLISKHNCVPSHYLSAEEFLSTCKEACFLMCCHCERVFTDQENFFDHVCSERATTSSDKPCWSCGIKGTSPHLPLCKASIEQPSSATQKTNKATNQKSVNSKQNKSSKKTFANVEHITADSPSKPLSPRLEPEQTCDIANLCTVDMEPTTIKSEPMSPEKSPRERSPSFSEDQKDETEPESNEDPESNNKDDVNNHVEEEKPDSPKNNEPMENDCENDQEMEENEIFDENAETENKNETPPPDEELNTENDNCESPAENCIESEKDVESDSNMETKINTETNDTETVREDDEQQSVDLPMNASDSDRKASVSEPEMEIENDTTEEVRRVPKVTLKLPPPRTTYSDNDSEDSEKLTMEVEENEESEPDYEESQENNLKEVSENEKPVNGFEENEKEYINDKIDTENFPIAGDDVSIVELELEQPLDKFTTENLLKTCLAATISTCIYCNHARKIAVNGKQLGLHAIAEHRFAATVNSITAEELIPYNFVVRIKDGLTELEDKYFNLEVKIKEEEGEEQPSEITFKREYECFQCRYVTAIHKELYLHNRKMHAKTILLCIICKSNFYSYSELICHLCPGNYDLSNEMKFRCCMCDIDDLPSAFRLMVHLRKRHHTCDVCLEGCINQSRLSNHVWKHKLHHLCYRCGIAYRNKPDITKHLFWKHGTESVLCKKCLQKKWPHVYHFCIPPASFVCEECNFSFSRAVYLKVHKRLHNNERKHTCTEDYCTESFISKKLLFKHIKRHQEPEPVLEKPIEIMNGDVNCENNTSKPELVDKENLTENKEIAEETKPAEKEDLKAKNIIDVYDLPALNLSESDSDDSEDESPKSVPPVPTSEDPPDKIEDNSATEKPAEESSVPPNVEPSEEEPKSTQIVDGIWDNFKQYQATIEKRDTTNVDGTTGESSADNLEENKNVNIEKENLNKIDIPKDSIHEDDAKDVKIEKQYDEMEEEMKPDINVIMADHDYCTVLTPNKETGADGKTVDKTEEGSEMDHDYCTTKEEGQQNVNTNVEKVVDIDKKKSKSLKKKNSSSSDSSSDSDSSSCTCGSNCSCSSSSGSSSSSSSSSDSESSSSEGKRRIAARRERRKERAKRKKESETSQAASNNSAVDVVASEENNPLPPIIELPIEESDLDTDETETDEDFYDEHPQRLANKILEEKRNQLMLLAGVTPPVSNGSIVQNSRPSTPSIPDEVPAKKKVKSKKRKKKSRSSTPKQDLSHHIPSYHNHLPSPLAAQPPIPPIPSIIHRPTIPSPVHQLPVTITPTIPRHSIENPLKQSQTTGSGSETDSNVRSSKRRRVPNKFYGYSSDDESADKPPPPPILKWRKADLPSTPTHHVTASPKFVPPITIKNIPSPAPVIEPTQAPVVHHTEVADSDSEVDDAPARKSSSDSSDSNRNDDSDSDGGQLHISQPQIPVMPVPQVQRTNENLYCYCQCPYDEVSEMIACDGRECAIEWFHFECVGIMVPPKGKWFCPDCRKKSTIRSDFIQA